MENGDRRTKVKRPLIGTLLMSTIKNHRAKCRSTDQQQDTYRLVSKVIRIAHTHILHSISDYSMYHYGAIQTVIVAVLWRNDIDLTSLSFEPFQL